MNTPRGAGRSLVQMHQYLLQQDMPAARRALRDALRPLTGRSLHWNSYFTAATRLAPSVGALSPLLAHKMLRGAEPCFTTPSERDRLRTAALAVASNVSCTDSFASLSLYKMAYRLSPTTTTRQEVVTSILSDTERACSNSFYSESLKLGALAVQLSGAADMRPVVGERLGHAAEQINKSQGRYIVRMNSLAKRAF